MLNEPGGISDALPLPITPTPIDTLHDQIRAAVEQVFFIESEADNLKPPYTASYTGTLTMDSVEAYDKLDALLTPLDHLPMFTMEDSRQVVRVVRGRFHVRPRPVWPNVALFTLTVLSLLFVGAANLGADFHSATDLLLGWPYALGVILILGTHEMGHYFAARYHKVAVTLPYFIPMPLGYGTMGAFIQLRQLMKNRRVLLDIGAAGPFAGMGVGISIFLIWAEKLPPQPMSKINTLILHSSH